MDDPPAKVSVGANALEYAREFKLWGSFEQSLVATWDGTESAWVVVPPSEADTIRAIEDVDAFRWGGRWSPSALFADDWLADAIEEHLETFAQSVALLHAMTLRFQDKWTPASTVRVNSLIEPKDDTLYCLLDAGTRNHTYIEAAIRDMSPGDWSTTVFSEAVLPHYTPGHEPLWFTSVVDEIVRNWQTILVGAFDDETFLAIERQPRR